MRYGLCMALPVIEDVWRITLNWESNTMPSTHNVFHLHAPSGTGADVADFLQTNLDATMFRPICDVYVLNSFSLIKLDGLTPSFDVTMTTPIDGLGDGQPVPAVAGIISFKSTQRGPQGRGRQYIGPVGESDMQNGIALYDTDALETAWTTFTEAAQSNDPPMDFGVASYTHEAFYGVAQFHAPLKLATQRRRQDAIPSGF